MLIIRPTHTCHISLDLFIPSLTFSFTSFFVSIHARQKMLDFFGEKGAESTQSRRMSESSNPTSQYSRKVKRNDDVDVRFTAARNCPITGSSWHILRPVSHFPPCYFFPRPLHSSLFSLFRTARGYARGDAWTGTARGAESKGDKIYKYVGGARDPFQCLFNQE